MFTSPYPDTILMGGLLEYHYRKGGPHHRDNVGLREAMRRKTPLIYFLGIEPGKYLAEWPVFIVEDIQHAEIFRVLIDEKNLVENFPFLIYLNAPPPWLGLRCFFYILGVEKFSAGLFSWCQSVAPSE